MFDKIDFHEYYDVAADLRQQTNLWNASSAALQGSLHAELVNLYTCTGTRTEVSNCHARSASPLLPPAPPPALPGPQPGGNCDAINAVLNDTNINGADVIRPCPLVAFPGTYQGALQCEASCRANRQCVAWLLHHKNHEQWRCCVKNSFGHGCTPVKGMWSGVVQH